MTPVNAYITMRFVFAAVAELADALDSGSSVHSDMQVQVLSSAVAMYGVSRLNEYTHDRKHHPKLLQCFLSWATESAN